VFLDGRDLCFNAGMSEKEFDVVKNRLRETAEQLRQATDPQTRRCILSAMRELLAEADRLTLDSQE